MTDIATFTNWADAILQFSNGGLVQAQWWHVLLVTLALTHITIASVTIFLHRSQAHRSLSLHPVAAHFFRFWLWLTTAIVTKEWVAVHRKHHAKCETAQDPHSPVVHGIKKVLLQGRELYAQEAKNLETQKKYGQGTPNDWLEWYVYTGCSNVGICLMLALNFALFGVLGISVWAIQMLWIPVTAAGIVNGLGHWWGYRNFEAADASTNISPWGILIGGEELHNNHHTYPTSAKLSVKPFEFDIGWVYIRAMALLRLAQVRTVPPRLTLGDIKPLVDAKTLEATIAHRYELMAAYAREVRLACALEVARLKNSGHTSAALRLNQVRQWMHRDHDRVPHGMRAYVQSVRENHPKLDQLLTMREELRQVWTRSNANAEQLIQDLQAWCHRAEISGIAALEEFSRKLRAVHA